MEVVNPFILKNKERMVVFLDQLSSVQEPGNPPQNSNNVDIGKYFAVFSTFHFTVIAIFRTRIALKLRL